MTDLINMEIPSLTGVSIIIPAFNEAKTIGAIVSSLKHLEKIQEILVVDDGSTDATAEVARDNGARVISHRRCSGNGAAVKTGLQNAAADWVLIIDADGQHKIEDVVRLIQMKPDYDLVVGARNFSMFRYRDFGNLTLASISTILTGEKIPDLTSGLRRLNRKIALSFIYLYPDGFSFPSTSTIAFLMSGYLVGFLPIENKPRPPHASASKLHPIRHGVKFMTIIYRIIMLSNPLRFFATVGFTFIAMGIAWVIRTMRLSRQVSAAGALLLLAGLTVILFGSIADQLSQLRKTISKLMK